MASFRFYLLSAVVCSVLVVGQAINTPPPTKFVDVATAETTQKPETTTEPETTTPSTTTTTPATTTSTTPSTTSTTSTTTSTTPSTTTTTTPSTTTSTQAPPSPTPKPGPPDMGTWTWAENNKTCIVIQFAAQLNVTYPKANVTVGSAFVGVKQVNVPANATVVSGWCGETNQSLTLSWPATVDKDNTITILFAKNGTSYELKSLNVTLVPSIFPNISNVDAIDLSHGVEWQTPLATSYRCAAPTKLTLTTAEPGNVAATLTLSQLQEEAFRSAAGTGFSAARDCAGGDIPDAVPIAVGCALGGMVLVVLIAYLVARRRSAARGYLSM